eukprot:31260-Pelagococcus_subviridis.AAC.11
MVGGAYGAGIIIGCIIIVPSAPAGGGTASIGIAAGCPAAAAARPSPPPPPPPPSSRGFLGLPHINFNRRLLMTRSPLSASAAFSAPARSIPLRDSLVHAADEQRRDALILRRHARDPLLARALQHLLRDRVVDAVVAVLDVLRAQLRRRRQLRHVRVSVARSVRAVGAIARVPQPERAYRRLVLLVVRLLPRELLDHGVHLRARGGLDVLAVFDALRDLVRVKLDVHVRFRHRLSLPP